VTVSPQLLAFLVCPRCKGALEHRDIEHVLGCHSCRLEFPIRDGIPIMLIDEAKPL